MGEGVAVATPPDRGGVQNTVTRLIWGYRWSARPQRHRRIKNNGQRSGHLRDVTCEGNLNRKPQQHTRVAGRLRLMHEAAMLADNILLIAIAASVLCILAFAAAESRP